MIAYGRTQSAFSEEGLPIGAGLEDLGKGLRSQMGIDFVLPYLAAVSNFQKRM